MAIPPSVEMTVFSLRVAEDSNFFASYQDLSQSLQSDGRQAGLAERPETEGSRKR